MKTLLDYCNEDSDFKTLVNNDVILYNLVKHLEQYNDLELVAKVILEYSRIKMVNNDMIIDYVKKDIPRVYIVKNNENK